MLFYKEDVLPFAAGIKRRRWKEVFWPAFRSGLKPLKLTAKT